MSVSTISKVSLGAKRLLLGRPFRSDTEGNTLLRKLHGRWIVLACMCQEVKPLIRHPC